MRSKSTTEEADDQFNDRCELDDTNKNEWKEDNLRDRFGWVEVAETDSEEGDNGEIDAL